MSAQGCHFAPGGSPKNLNRKGFSASSRWSLGPPQAKRGPWERMEEEEKEEGESSAHAQSTTSTSAEAEAAAGLTS